MKQILFFLFDVTVFFDAQYGVILPCWYPITSYNHSLHSKEDD